jgi:beta-galactosidase
MKETGKPDITGWALTRAFESWSWEGCEGLTTTVEVYSRAAQVELLVNGKSVGKKRTDKTFRTLFKRVAWEPGTIEAVAYDASGRVCGRSVLYSAGAENALTVTPEEKSVAPDGLAFVLLTLTDGKGTVKPLERKRIQVSVENGELVGLGSACTYLPLDDNYTDDVTDTYYGEAMAVVRANGNGDVKVCAKAIDGSLAGETVIPLGEAKPRKYEVM